MINLQERLLPTSYYVENACRVSEISCNLKEELCTHLTDTHSVYTTGIKAKKIVLTLVLLNPDIPCLCKHVDPDELASEEANRSGSALFAIKFVNL